jgi:hypothetical protein
MKRHFGTPHPNANGYAERWVRTIRADCLDRILILGRRHLERVLRVYRLHYNEHRPHRSLHLLPPDGREPKPLKAPDRLQRRDLLGGLLHEYEGRLNLRTLRGAGSSSALRRSRGSIAPNRE